MWQQKNPRKEIVACPSQANVTKYLQYLIVDCKGYAYLDSTNSFIGSVLSLFVFFLFQIFIPQR
jgi:hypothetical protein